MREKIVLQMKDSGIIPVYNHSDADTALHVMKSCRKAGLQVFEFTNRGTHSAEVFAQLREAARDWEGFYLGIGTIFTTADAKQFYEMGADFLVSPIWDEDLASYTSQHDITWIPGIGTVSEAYRAYKSGIGLIKAFPANVLGAEFIKAVRSVIPDLKIMPTGGVTTEESNLATWAKAGVHCVGMGSQLFAADLIEGGKFEELENKIYVARESLNRFRRF